MSKMTFFNIKICIKSIILNNILNKVKLFDNIDFRPKNLVMKLMKRQRILITIMM